MASTLAATESPHTIQVDFAWSKLGYLIQDKATQKPLMRIKFHCLKPHMEFIDAESEQTIATSSIHNFSIHADCTIGSQSIRLKAQKRWSTKYSYLSYAYSDNEDPVVMTLTTSSSLKNWDFILLDENLEPVARYSTNVWALKKVGNIEFVGPKAGSKAVRDEVAVVVSTLYYCITVRCMSIFSPFASAFADVKPVQAPNDTTKETAADVK